MAWQVPYAIITFPFTFAIMFGDAGHGLILLLVAIYFIVNEKKMGPPNKLHEMVQMPFDGRYVLFLMAVFSVFCGTLYNEVFGIPVDIFGSRWKDNGNPSFLTGADTCGLSKFGKNCTLPPADPYPYGMDPAWKWYGSLQSETAKSACRTCGSQQ
eukprot:SAG31_NODE_173_length_21354_cov_16.826112_4_plen_155_part_00